MITRAARSDRRDAADLLDRVPPVASGIVGAACIAFSAPLVALSQTGAATASFFRCVLALPFLLALALLERRRRGGLPWKEHAVALLAGTLLGGDLLLWSQSIGEVGAGVSTVIVNLQVILVPLIALVVDHERLTRRWAIAVAPMLIGVAMTSGVGGRATGSDPVLGTVHASLAALCYAGYLFLLRRGAKSGHLVAPVLDVTIAAAVVSLVAGGLWHGIRFVPGWPALGWLLLLAVSGQVVGWLFISSSLPRLGSAIGAALLLLQPVGAVLLGLVLLRQVPSPVQLAGCVLVLAAVLVVSVHRRSAEHA